MLSIKNVSKSFGDIVALEEISFNVNEGEFVFLTGPSGAGKTTLLRLIIREMLPDEGEIIFEDKDLSELKRKYDAILGGIKAGTVYLGDISSGGDNVNIIIRHIKFAST